MSCENSTRLNVERLREPWRLDWSILKVERNYECKAAKLLELETKLRSIDFTSLVPTVLRPRLRGPPTEVVAIPGHLFVLMEVDEVKYLKGYCSLVSGFMPEAGNSARPSVVTMASMDAFMSELQKHNASLSPKRMTRAEIIQRLAANGRFTLGRLHGQDQPNHTD